MKRLCLIIFSLAIGLTSINADSWVNYSHNSSEGQEFYVTFMFNNAQQGSASLHLQLFMAARQSAKVTITTLSRNQVDTMTVDSFLIWELPTPSDAYSQSSNAITYNSLKVESDKPISLYFSSFDNDRGDASLVLPANVLSNEYVIQSSNVNQQAPSFAIIATEDGTTTVTINPSVSLLDHTEDGEATRPPLPAHNSYDITLSKGQVYYAAASSSQNDISGTTISATQKIAVYNGSQYSYVVPPLGKGYEPSHIFHQAQPVMMCGVRYPLVKFVGQSSCVVRVTAIYDSTYIYQNGVLIDSLNAFQTKTINWTTGQNSMYIETSKQSYCYQYMPASRSDAGSPAMVFVNDLEQDIQSAKFTTFTINIVDQLRSDSALVQDSDLVNFLNIVVPTSSVGRVQLDNATIPASDFHAMDGLSGYSYAQIQISHGDHELTNSSGFVATVYGYDTGIGREIPSYAYNPGFNCIHQDAYFLINGDRVPEAFVKEGADSLWHLTLTSVVNGDYDSIQWYDYYSGGSGGGGGAGGGGGGGGWGTYLGTGDVLYPSLVDPQEHTIYMVVYRHSPLTGDTVIDGVFADLYCCQNTHDIIDMPQCQTDTVEILGKIICCDTLIIGKIYSFRQDTVCKYGCDSITTWNLHVINRQDSNISKTICLGDTCKFRGHDFTEQGTYYTLDSVGSCYYYDTLNLTVNPSYRFTDTDTICFNEQPYKWRSFDLTVDSAATYIFHDSLKTDLGCDSLFELILTVGAVDLITDTVHECTNHLPYEWHGKQYTTSGIYYDSLVSRFGCDSVHRLMLTIDTAYRFTDTMTVCSNDAFVWRDSLYDGFEPGIVTIYDSLITSLGCDSVYAMKLTVKPANIFYTDTTICDNETLIWRGHHIYGDQAENIPPAAEVVDSGYHLISDSLINALMCDSIYHLRLNVTKSYYQVFEDTICQGGSYFFDNTLLTWRNDIPGVHDSIVHYVSSMGCDSVLHLSLTVNPIYNIEHFETVCNNTTFNWKYADIDTTIYEQKAGTYDYYFYRQTASGCDSIHTLHLTVLDTVLVSTVFQISDKESFIWDNQKYGGTKCTEPCNIVLPVSATPYFYRHVYTAANGCDSIMTLSLTVCPTYDFTLNTQTCQHDDYDFNGKTWNWRKDIAGTHDTTYRYQTVAGYDSVWNIHLKVNPTYLLRDTQHTCQNEVFDWKGHKKAYSNLNPGVYAFFDSLKSVVGYCDSVHELILIVHDTIAYTEYQTICDNETIVWDGQLICGAMTPMETGTSCPARTEPYTFEHRYSSVRTGCDSIERLILSVKKSYFFELDTSLCSNEGFTYRDIVYTKSGTYCDSLKTADGCDSIYVLNLELGSQTTTKQYIGICEGDSFIYRGTVIKEPGIYYDTLTPSLVGCDSILELHFDILPTYYMRDTVKICDGGTYEWHGRTITHAGTFRDSLKTVGGCDSIYELFVFVAPKFHSIEYDTVCSNTVYHWRNKYFTESGTYFDSLISKSGCDSIYELRLTMNKPSIHEEYVEICAGNTFNFRGKIISKPGVYYDTLNSTHGCDSVYMLVLNFAKTYYFHDTVQICDGNTYNWHGRTITHAGTYRDSLTTFNSGCDSIYELFVKIAPKYHYVEYDTICSDNIYRWHNKDFTTSGTYFDSLQSSLGCDSVYELRLTVNKPSIHEQYIEICAGNSYDFRGKKVSKSGIYYDTLRSTHGCDSIFKLTFNITPTYYFRDTVQICDGNTYNWHGKTITHAGTYRDSLTTFNSGCDSIYELFVKIAPKYHYVEYDTICSDNIYRWHNKDFTTSGTYFDSLQSSLGCDSVYELRLTVNKPSIHEQYIEICAGNSYDFRGKKVSKSGIYYDTLRSTHGCDSIFKLTFNITPTYYFRDTVQICDGNTYNWHGKTITHAGTYRDSITTFNSGCDSIYELFVKVAPKFHDIAYDTVCSINTYHWRGKWITESGTYFDTLRSSQGCDSVYEMRLTMYRPDILEEYVEVCAGGSFNFRGREITQPGVYYDTLKNAHGCDSIYKLVFNYAKTYYFRDTTQICDGETYNFRGRAVTLEGTYRDTMKTVSGCDSIFEMFVKVAPKFHDIAYDTVCSNQSYHWRGKWLTESGTYFDSLKSTHGCDSVYEMRLTMYRSTIHEEYIEICQGASFDFRGRRVTQPGVYYDTAKNVHGCDSIYKLVLNYAKTYYFHDTAQICDGESFNFRGKTLRNAGTYRDSLKTVSGCDSIYELFLKVAPKFHNIEYDTICSNKTYHWRDKWLTEGGTYFDSLKNSQGCDSIYELRLAMFRSTVHEMYVEVCEGDSFDFRGKNVTAPGVYYDTILNSHGCDSIIKLVFNVTRDYHFHETLQICDGDTDYWHGQKIYRAGTFYDYQKTVNSGCDSIYELSVTMVHKYHFIEYDTVCSDNVYLWRNKSLTESGTYFDSLKSTQGCDSVYEMRLTMFRPTFHEMYVEVCQGDSFDFRGRNVTVPGVYYDTITNSHGCDSIIKLVFNVTRSYRFHETLQICDGDIHYWHGKQIYKAGTYRDSLKTYSSGCDSIYELVVTMVPTYHFIEQDTLCSENVYLWRGKHFTESGTYFDSLRSTQGCDSVYELRLTMFRPTFHEMYVEVCQGDSFDFRGKNVTVPGVYYDTITNSHGCDSIIKLVFNVTRDYRFYETLQICDGDIHYWHGKQIYKAGTYRDSLKTYSSGCDSIYELVVTMAPKYHFIEYDTVCSENIYLWRNKSLTESGTYFDSLKNSQGCDSVYEMRLTMFRPTFHEMYVEVCQGESFDFRGKNVASPGVYYDTITNSHGCDSIIKLVFNVTRSYRFYETLQICDGDIHYWHGKQIYKAGTYRDSLKTFDSGCDSIYELFVTMVPKYHFIEYDTVCSDNVYLWRNKRLTESGTYFDSLKSTQGCDSVYELRLAMFRPTITEQYVEVCQGGSFYFRGEQITEPGVYYDTMRSMHGCDSIIKYTFNVTRTYYFRDTVLICDGDTYNFHGRPVTYAGTYRDTLKTVKSGCDSIYELFVQVAPKFHQIEYDTIISNTTYHWRGKWITESGTYFDTLKSHYGCDSVYELRLTMYVPPVFEKYVEVCEGTSYNFRGQIITESGIYYDTLITSHGFDSVYMLVIDFVNTYYFRDTTYICDGQTYNFRGRTITHAGTYRDSLKTATCGCDSIYELYVLSGNPFHDVKTVEICSDTTYFWRGKSLTESGTYYDTLNSHYGCDSVYELRLTMYRTTRTELYIEVCAGGSFDFRGRPVTEPGTYYDTLTNVHGCDSIVKLVFNFSPSYYMRDTVVLCDGDVYNFRGRNIIRGGTYRDTLKTSVSGCDSIYEVFVDMKSQFHSVAYDTVCSDTVYHWRGKHFTESGIYFDTLKSHFGCDSIYELRLTMYRNTNTELYIEVCAGGSFDFRGKAVTEPGTYYDTLTNVHGCDSIVKLVFNFAPSYYMRDTVTICEGDVYDFRGRNIIHGGTYRDTLKTAISGCDSIYEMFVIVEPKFHKIESDTVCSDTVYYWRNKNLTESGIYYDSLKSHYGCDSIYEMRLTMYRPSIHEEYVEVCQGGSFLFRGRLITKQGVYYDTLTNVHGCDSIIKLVFNYARSYYFRDTVIICDGDVYNFRGKPLTFAGTYRDTLKTVSGCDSIFEKYIIVKPKFHKIAYDTVCSDSVYYWHGKNITKSGTYFDSLKNHFGCDSVYELRLVMGTPTLSEYYIEVCEGESFSFRGNMVTQPGIYYDTLINSTGCDSVMKYVFNVTRSYHFYENMTICDGEAKYWHSQKIYKAGTYFDSLTTVTSGCDSIYELRVTMADTYHIIEYDTVCSNNVYLWRGKHFTKSGTYFDSLRSSMGCDSVFELRLTVDSATMTEIYIEICQGNGFSFRGSMITEPGVYYDTLVNRRGCDSVLRYVFNVTRTYHFYETHQICDGSTYRWHNKNITLPGTYFDSLTTATSGCDSIYELHVTHAIKYYYVQYDTICSNETYNWQGQWLSASGTYIDSLVSSAGCDSILELRLTVYPNMLVTKYQTLCPGSSIVLNRQTITKPGIYYDTLQRSTLGCDSIIKLIVSYAPVYEFVDTAYICEGHSITFHGKTLTAPGTYRDTLVSTSGCDSIHKLVLKTHPKYQFTIDTTICSNDVLIFAGQRITASGTYYDRHTSIFGCDSTYILNATVNNVTYNTLRINMCADIGYTTPTGKHFATSGTYRDTLINRNGCDSIVTYYVNAYTTIPKYDTLAICRGSSAKAIDGNTYNVPGDYTTRQNRSTTSGAGCDTIFYIHVYLDNVVINTVASICQGDSYPYRGNVYTQSGTYPHIVAAQDTGQCDTVYTLYLTVNPISHTAIYDTTCDNSPYWFNGVQLTQSGDYTDTIPSAGGCDSVVTLHLVIHDKIVDTVYRTICYQDSFEWYGRWYKYDGTYNYIDVNPQTGCNIYRTLVLTTIKQTQLISVLDVDMCQDENDYSIIPTYSGSASSLFTLRYDGVNIPASNDIVDGWFDGTTITVPIPLTKEGNHVRPDNYTVSLQIGSSDCGMGTQAMNFNLLVRYPSSILEQHFNDVVSVLNHNYNGGYSFSDYRWYVNGKKAGNANGSNLYDLNLSANDIVYAELQRKGDTYFIPTCPITIVDLGPDDIDYPVTVVSGHLIAQVTAKEAATYRLCTVSGLILKSGELVKDEDMELTLPYIAGCYFLVVDTENAGRKIFKLVVN